MNLHFRLGVIASSGSALIPVVIFGTRLLEHM